MALTLNHPTRTYGQDTTEIFTVTLTGDHGYPEGTVEVYDSTTKLCTATLTRATTDSSDASCSLTASQLPAGDYTSVYATYTPGTPSSSITDYTYTSSTSSPDKSFAVTGAVTRIFGATADGTAAQELANQFTPALRECPAAGSVVLARDTYFADALSSQYLASYLDTGTLLTPSSHLSTVTKTALRDEGITHVYIVGGPLAVSTTVLDALQELPAYTCGGGSLRGET